MSVTQITVSSDVFVGVMDAILNSGLCDCVHGHEMTMDGIVLVEEKETVKDAQVETISTYHEEDVFIKTGTFHWVDHDGREHTAEFMVRTCEDDGTYEARDQRWSDKNEQFSDTWLKINNHGAKEITYVPVLPDPFL